MRQLVREDEYFLSEELRQGRYVWLLLSDNGSGMSARTLERIFDPFFATKPTGKGTGLGLSVVHRIITSHGGTVRVDSEPGKRTAFHVYFPAVTNAVETHEAIPQPFVAGSGQRILFVDDEPLLVSTGKAALERWLQRFGLG